MMSRLMVACCVFVGVVAQVSGQEPTRTLPDNYKVQFENDHLRVVRVHYPAGAKLPDHTHAAGTTVYVYLNDSDGVVFRHSGRSSRTVTRPAVTTGSVRVATGGEEHHTAENPASAPSDFLRIWLKTESSGERTMRRLAPGDETFENKQLRVTRLRPRSAEQVSASQNHPALLVALPSGDTQWLNAGATHQLAAGEYLRIDLLMPPRQM